jgi:hypothetical protein
MAIHRASDDPPNITTYCTVDDVLLFGRGIDVDDEDNCLSTLGTGDTRKAAIEAMLPVSFENINAWARRDFALHEAKTVILDGYRSDAIRLSELGFSPLVDVTSITIDDTLVDEDDYSVYLGELAQVERADGPIAEPAIAKRLSWAELFTEGVQNVSLEITWGYARPPQKIRNAQAFETLALLLEDISAKDDMKDVGIPAGVNAVAEGSFKVTLYGGGRYTKAIDVYRRRAMAACFDYHDARTLLVQPHALR